MLSFSSTLGIFPIFSNSSRYASFEDDLNFVDRMDKDDYEDLELDKYEEGVDVGLREDV